MPSRLVRSREVVLKGHAYTLAAEDSKGKEFVIACPELSDPVSMCRQQFQTLSPQSLTVGRQKKCWAILR